MIEKQIWSDDDKDVVMFAVLYLANDLDVFSRYFWGLLSWNKTINSMWQGINGRHEYCLKNHQPYIMTILMVNYPIIGFLIEFQVSIVLSI